MKKIPNKKSKKYQLPSVDGIDVMGLLEKVKVEKTKTNNPPTFTLERLASKNNIAKQLKKQKIEFDPSVIKTYDKLIKGIVGLRNEKFISENEKEKLIHSVYERSIKHVCFIYECI